MTDDTTLPAPVSTGDPYTAMDAGEALRARGAAEEIRKLVKRATADMLKAGGLLNEMKEMLGHGRFQLWAHAEFGAEFSGRTGRLYMQAAVALEEARIKVASVASLPITAVAAAAAAPAEARPALLERAAAEKLTVAQVRDAARAAAAPAPQPRQAGAGHPAVVVADRIDAHRFGLRDDLEAGATKVAGLRAQLLLKAVIDFAVEGIAAVGRERAGRPISPSFKSDYANRAAGLLAELSAMVRMDDSYVRRNKVMVVKLSAPGAWKDIEAALQAAVQLGVEAAASQLRDVLWPKDLPDPAAFTVGGVGRLLGNWCEGHQMSKSELGRAAKWSIEALEKNPWTPSADLLAEVVRASKAARQVGAEADTNAMIALGKKIMRLAPRP